MSEEVAISEVSSNGASISSPSQPAQSHRDSGISHTSLAEEAQRRTQAASVNSTSDSPLLPTIPSVAPPVDDISWDLGHYETGVAKNLLNDISEEQMSKLDEVLSLDEVQEFLQQTGSNSFPSEMSEAPPPDTASGLSAEDQATPLSDGDKLAGKTELFSSTGEPLKLEDLDLDDETAHEIIKKGIREQDVASIAVSFSDHAYALAPDKESKTTGAVAMATPPSTASPSAKTTTTPFSTPRKSSRIAKRKGIPLEESVKSEEETRTGTEDDGGKSAETEEETSRTDESEDGRKRLSEDEPTKGKGRGKKKVQAVPRPTRRSTRISEHEQREMAEKIRQENLRKEREEMDAMMKAKEEERLQEEDKKEKEKKEKEKQEKQELEKASESEENVEEDSQQEVEEMEGVLTSVPQKPAGRGRGRGRKAGAKAEVKPGAKAVAKGVQTLKKPRGRGRGRGKKAGTEESEAASQTQSSSTEDEVPLRTLTKKGRKVPKKGAKAVPSETPAPDTTDAKRKEADGPVGSDAEDSVPLGKLKTGTTKTLDTSSEVKSPEVKSDTKTAEKKGSEDQKVKAVGIRQRRPTGRKSESEIQALSLASDLFKPDAVIVHQQTDEGRQPTGEAGCQADEESDGGLSYEDDENDSDWDPGENADKLWCICKKPHGNRFMICCDRCQGWFHGRCVGISKARGKEMEKRNEEYVCPVCTAEKLKQPSDGDVVDISFKTESETKQEKKEGKETTDSKIDVKIKTEESANKTDVENVRTDIKVETDSKSTVSSDAKKEAPEKTKDIKPAAKQQERSFLSAISGLSQSSGTVSGTVKPDQKSKVEKPVLKTEKSKDGKKTAKGEVKSYGEKIDKTLGEIRKRAAQVLADRKKKRFKGLGDHKRTFERCIVEGCGQESRPDSVYCSDQCIEKYSEDSLHIIRQERERNQGQRRSSSEGTKKAAAAKVVVMERRTGRVLTGPSAPSESNLGDWLRTHPSFEVLRPAHASHKITTSFYKKDRGDHKDSKHSSSHHSTSSSHHQSGSSHHHSGSSHHHSSSAHSSSSSTQHLSSGPSPASSTRDDSGPDPVRLNVRRSLRDVLAHRANEADDIMLSNSEIKKIALSIEEELYNLFQETGTKYKAKYRSLIFNIKDLKNKGLFRKILTTQIKAYKLVRMTAEELASKELAKWREMENKHTLEMIELAEKEAQEEAGKQHVTKKTHKGVEEVADEDLSSLVTVEAEEKKPKLTSPVVSPAGLPGDLLSSLIVDTTEQHRMHLFDLNCKVCTGKVAPPSAEEPPAKKVKVARTVSKESTEGLPAEKEEPLPEVVEEKEVKEVLKVIEKVKAEEELAASTAADSTSVTVRSPDSALQSGLEITPRGHMVGTPALWKGFVHMQDLARFVTSAHAVSGPTYHLTLPDSIQLCGRIAPEQVWDYLARIKKAGSKDICVIRFDPSSGEEKGAYVQLYSYLNSRSRCGVCGNNSKHIKDLYIVPLAAHCKIPSILLPFDGPGLQENRPHMLIGIVVKQKSKRPSESVPPEAGSKPVSTDGPSQVKRLRQPVTSRTTPRKSALDPRKQNPLDPRERLRGGTTLKASPLQRDDMSADEQSNTPPEHTPPSTDPPKPKINDPIVQEYGQVDLKKLEEDASAGKTVVNPSEAAVEEDEPYDPEDMEGILLKPGLRSKAGNVTVAETTVTAKTTDIANTKTADQKSLLMDLTRKVEEQKREIQLKKLGLESKTSSAAEPGSLAPTLSTLITTLKAANLNLLERATATTAATSSQQPTTSQQPPAAKPAASSTTNWDEIIKANLGSMPQTTATTTPTSTAPVVEPSKTVQAKEMKETTQKMPDPRKDKGSDKDSVHKSEREEKKAKEPEKSKTDQPKGSDRKKSRDGPRHESSRSSSSPDRRHNRRSPKSRDSRRHSRSPSRRRDDSCRKEGSSRRRSKSSERRSNDSRRSGDSRSSSHRSRHSDRDRDRDHGHSRRNSRSPRDKSRSHRSEKPRMSSTEKERDNRSSSREQVAKESPVASGVGKAKSHIEAGSESSVASTTPAVSTSGIVVASVVSTLANETVAASGLHTTSVVPKQNKTESQILDDLVLGKQTQDPPKTEAAVVSAEGGKDSKLIAEPVTTSANLPAIPGFGFETTIPMSEISDILKNISRVTASAGSNVVSSAESVVSSTVSPMLSAHNDNPGRVGSPNLPSHGGNIIPVTNASGMLGDLGIAVTEGKGDMDYRKQASSASITGPVMVPPPHVMSAKKDGQFGQKALPGPPLPVLAGSVPPVGLLQGQRPPGPPQGVTSVAQPRDVDLRRGDVPQQVGPVFMSIEDKDMRMMPADVGLGLGSGDSDMRIGSGDKDMRVRPGDIPGPGAVQGQPGPPPCMPLQPPPLPPHLLTKQVFTGDKDDRVVPSQSPLRTGTRPAGVEAVQTESHGRPRDLMRRQGPPGRSQALGQNEWQQFEPEAAKTMEKPPNTSCGPTPTISGRSVRPQGTPGLLPPPRTQIPQGNQPSEGRRIETITTSSQDERHLYPQHQFGQRMPPGIRLPFHGSGPVRPHGQTNLNESDSSAGPNDFVRHPSVLARGGPPGGRMLHASYRGDSLPRPPPPPPPGRGMMGPRGPRGPRGPHPNILRFSRGRGRGW